MNRPTPIVNMAGDYEEAVVRFAKHLGKNEIRRRVFDEIYGRVKKPRSKKEIMSAARIENRGNNSQQVQNALEHLWKHHLIARYDNDGQTNDGSRFIYGKEESVRANKDKIRLYADNTRLADKVPTKRGSLVQGAPSLRKIKKQSLTKKKHLNVLYLTSNPDNRSPLRTDAEVRGVKEAIRGSKFRDSITIEYRPSADLTSLIDGLNDFRPQIVHFSGHGHPGGIVTDTGKINRSTQKDLSFDLFAKALAATDNPPDIIVLNSCDSSAAKKMLLPPAKILISMREPISDIAAATFAIKFYAAIASGQSVRSAFAQGLVGVEDASISEYDTPELLNTPSTDPASLILT